MNIDTNELRMFNNEEEAVKEGFVPIPDELIDGAYSQVVKHKVKHQDKGRIIVTDGPLRLWAVGLKQGRNNVCACGSGKKYKNCCLKRSEE